MPSNEPGKCECNCWNETHVAMPSTNTAWCPNCQRMCEMEDEGEEEIPDGYHETRLEDE